MGSLSLAMGCQIAGAQTQSPAAPLHKPNLVYVFADQWRAQDSGYAGNTDVITPNVDKLARESVSFTTAVSGCSVCCPYRASLITGQYPLTHGVFLNDLCLGDKAVSIAQAYSGAGYDTAYIGKWHLDGHGRSSFIPRERRQGFQFWKVLECTHDYNNSFYYGDEDIRLKWEGYDAIAQTHEACRYLRERANAKPKDKPTDKPLVAQIDKPTDKPTDKPFALFLSWGPPHDPYQTAPEKYRSMFVGKNLKMRPNVPKEMEAQALKMMEGYYSHLAALDDCVGEITRTLVECGLDENTILVFTSDHGDMLGSHGQRNKQQPYDESILVPFLLRYPAALGRQGRAIDMLLNTPDIMPTLLGLSGVAIPKSVEGKDYSGVLLGKRKPETEAALITCPSPFGQWIRKNGGKEYRGVRTRRYTYARDLKGPWLLFDNQTDPYQLNNLCGNPEHRDMQAKLEGMLTQLLKETRDEFLPGEEYIKRWGCTVDKEGTVPYRQFPDPTRPASK
ncbi:MAG: sulfatase [Candidatus Sumerlaeota bacterium]|nr:sulfatase [Candidatus Sumerlaeota bacterium]